MATSLGLGVKQMATGLNVLFGLDPGVVTQITLIVVISAVATLSAVSGVGRGIRIISEWNIYISIVLLGFFLFFGPFEWLMGLFVTSVGAYLWDLVPMGLWTAAEGGGASWQGNWTIFYWGWWIAWAPFVGLFIARISRGRTIREFILCAMGVPTFVGMGWICLFGGNALYMELYAEGGPGTAGLLQLANDWQLEAVLYGTIERMSDLELADHRHVGARHPPVGHLVHHILGLRHAWSSRPSLSLGDDHPPQRFRVVWGAAQGFVAAVLLVAGGLEALQAASIAAALPVSFVMVLMTLGVIKSLAEDPSAVEA